MKPETVEAVAKALAKRYAEKNIGHSIRSFVFLEWDSFKGQAEVAIAAMIETEEFKNLISNHKES